MIDKFKLIKSEPYIENIETGECYDLDFDNFSYIVKVMNDLSNENEQLKQQIKDLRLGVLDSIHEANEIQCSCNPCVVEECVKRVVE